MSRKHINKLRNLTQKEPTEKTWQAICWLLDHWPSESTRRTALSFAHEHLKDWPMELRVAPRSWWEVACMGAAPPALGLARIIRPGTKRIDGARFRNLVNAAVLKDLVILDLNDNNIGPHGARHLAEARHLTELQEIHLAGNQVLPEGARALSRAKHMRKLRVLDLGNNKLRGSGAKGLARNNFLKNLLHLHLPYNSFRDSGIARLMENSPFHALQTLNLSHNGIQAEGAAILGRSNCLHMLRRLDLSSERKGHQSNQIGPEGASGLVATSSLKNLRVLALSHQVLGAEGARTILGAKHLNRLTHLDLRSNELGADALDTFEAQEHLSGLEELRLDDNQLGDEGIRALSAAQNLGELRRLTLENNAITGAGLEALSGASLGSLTTLRLSHNPLGDQGVMALIKSPIVQNLTRLELVRCEISDESVQALAALENHSGLSVDISRNGISSKGKLLLRESEHLSQHKSS